MDNNKEGYTDTEMERIILDIVREEAEDDEIEMHTELIESGILDSIILYLILDAIDKRFQVSFIENELDISRFTTVHNIYELVKEMKEKNQ